MTKLIAGIISIISLAQVMGYGHAMLNQDRLDNLETRVDAIELQLEQYQGN